MAGRPPGHRGELRAELRTPLTNIQLNIDLAADAAEDAPQEAVRRLALVREEGQRLSRLIDNVLTFARQERGEAARPTEGCVPDQVIARTLEQFAPAFARRGLRVQTSGQADARCRLDADALAQILANLLSNVEKHVPGGNVKICSSFEDGVLLLRVEDDGPGIPASAADRVFQPFERLCHRVRAADAKVPVLFLSAKNEEIDVVVGLQLGADDFIRKPFGKHELLARIATVLRRARPSAEPSRSFALRDLLVWPGELRAERDGTSIGLSPREAAILALLHEHAGQVVDRDTLLHRCWEMDYFPESRTLDQHIAKLRKRLETGTDNPLIETVRGVDHRVRK